MSQMGSKLLAASLIAGTLAMGLAASPAQAGWGQGGQYGNAPGSTSTWGGYGGQTGGHPGTATWLPRPGMGGHPWSVGGSPSWPHPVGCSGYGGCGAPSWVHPYIHYPPVATPPIYWHPPIYHPPVVIVRPPIYRPPVVVVQRPVYAPPRVVYAPPVYTPPPVAYVQPPVVAPAPVTYTAPVVAPVVTPAVTPVQSPCTCLTKTYTQDGQVVFSDICTKETASAVLQASQPAPVADAGQATQAPAYPAAQTYSAAPTLAVPAAQ